MTRSKASTAGTLVTSFFTSAFIGAAAALLLSATLSTPTTSNVRVTRLEPEGGNPAGYYADLGVLGACSNIPTYTSNYWSGGDCQSTQVGYRMNLLLPYRANATDTDAESIPYPLSRDYWVVDAGDARDLVIVPVATAFQLFGLLTYILSSCVKAMFVGWVAIFWICLAMVLTWASFGLTYNFTDTVQANLRAYNEDSLAVVAPLSAHRGNAVWFLAAAGALLTVALIVMVLIQLAKVRGSRSSHAPSPERKRWVPDEDVEMS